MKYFLLAGLLSCSFFGAHAQSGCTDPAATNYNPSAVSNDGSCVYPTTSKAPVLRAVLPTVLTESSGLVYTDGKLWSHNDSGNPAEIYHIDTASGTILQTVHVDNYPNTDWEDLTADSNYIYIEDCGNNNGDRTDLKILKIAKSDIGSASDIHVNAQAINISYTDQTSFSPSSTNNFDCESLIAIRDSLYLFTKDRGDSKTRVYKVSKAPGTYQLSPYTTFNTAGWVTGADYDPAKNEVVLIGYLSDRTRSFLWFLNDFQNVMFFSGNKRRIEIGTTFKWQTEGVAYIDTNRLFISCETNGTIVASLYTTDKSWNTGNNAVSKVNHSGRIYLYPNPTYDPLYVRNAGPSVVYHILSMEGKEVQTGMLKMGNDTLHLKNLQAGRYNLLIKDTDGTEIITKVIKL